MLRSMQRLKFSGSGFDVGMTAAHAEEEVESVRSPRWQTTKGKIGEWSRAGKQLLHRPSPRRVMVDI